MGTDGFCENNFTENVPQLLYVVKYLSFTLFGYYTHIFFIIFNFAKHSCLNSKVELRRTALSTALGKHSHK